MTKCKTWMGDKSPCNTAKEFAAILETAGKMIKNAMRVS